MTEATRIYRVPDLDTLIARAVEAEREACAKIADDDAAEANHGSCSWGTATVIAEKIRARSTVK